MATNRYTSKIKSEFWHMARHAGYMELALKQTNPPYLRLSHLAVAFAGPNGHAQFTRSELADFLGVADQRTVDKAIATAVEYGILAENSHRRCLQIPCESTGDTKVFVPHAPGISKAAMDAKRKEPCPTCHVGIVRPAECHPDRERYTSVKNGSLCESCYRRRTRTSG